jgi:lysyl-tRNA synthetase, class II
LEFNPEAHELNQLMMRRREELEALKKLGVNPYPHEFDRTTFSTDILSTFTDDGPQRTVAIAGRIMSLRRMGKASFCHIMDMHGKIQIYLRKDDLKVMYDAFKLMDIGDIVGVEGFVFRTKMGEISVHAQKLVLLSKTLRPLPIPKETTDEQGNTIVFGQGTALPPAVRRSCGQPAGTRCVHQAE